MDFYTKAMVTEIIKRNENKNLTDFPICSICNYSNGGHYFYASLYMDALMARRRVFSWVPGDRIYKGYWMLVTHDRAKNEFYLLNNYYKEYLYASSQVEDNRRSVFTWVDGVPRPECIWTVKDSCIFNNFYQYFLYESSLSFNVDRQLTPCWVPGTHVRHDVWEFALENKK